MEENASADVVKRTLTLCSKQNADNQVQHRDLRAHGECPRLEARPRPRLRRAIEREHIKRD